MINKYYFLTRYQYLQRCGPGTWILELGTKYEKSNFKGIDAFAFFPSTIKPQNVSFEQHNILNGLPFEDNKFEYVIMRFMMFSLSLKEWENVINEMVRVCKPNGWIEIMEGKYILKYSFLRKKQPKFFF